MVKNLLNQKPYTFPEYTNNKMQNILTIGEMYCGPGGIGLAAKNTNISLNNKKYCFKHIWATDNHYDTCITYQKNIPLKSEKSFKVICEDIRELEIEKLPYVDGLLYGFPCNDFSNVGKTEGLYGKFGPLYTFGVKFIDRNNPKFFLAENVSGISVANSGKAFQQIYNDLSNAGTHGYKIAAHHYKFEEYGIPQARHRYILVGLRNDLNLNFKIPKPKFRNNFKTCKEAIENPPILDHFYNHEFTKQTSKVIERLKKIKPGENAWTAELPNDLKLNVSDAKLSMIYKRLDPNSPAYTVTGSGGGGTHIYHWSEPRSLTNRERARLQTFPDNFIFHGSKESIRRQIGMAVPVEGASIILEAILKTFAGIDYPNIEESHQFLNQKEFNF